MSRDIYTAWHTAPPQRWEGPTPKPAPRTTKRTHTIAAESRRRDVGAIGRLHRYRWIPTTSEYDAEDVSVILDQHIYRAILYIKRGSRAFLPYPALDSRRNYQLGWFAGRVLIFAGWALITAQKESCEYAL